MTSERLHPSRWCPSSQRCEYSLQRLESYYLFQLQPEWSPRGKVFQGKEEQRHLKKLVIVLVTSALKRLMWIVPRRLLLNEFRASVTLISFKENLRWLMNPWNAFPHLERADVDFLEQEFQWKIYTIEDYQTRRAAALDPEYETYIVHVSCSAWPGTWDLRSSRRTSDSRLNSRRGSYKGSQQICRLCGRAYWDQQSFYRAGWCQQIHQTIQVTHRCSHLIWQEVEQIPLVACQL